MIDLVKTEVPDISSIQAQGRLFAELILLQLFLLILLQLFLLTFSYYEILICSFFSADAYNFQYFDEG